MIAVSKRLLLRRLPLLACSALATGFGVLLLMMSAPHAQAETPSLDETIRFLEQATFGPTPTLIAHVRQVGFATFLTEQFNLPLPPYPNLGLWPQKPPAGCNARCRRENYTMYPLQVRFFRNALTAPDQLRQRVAFALSQIFVVSAQDPTLRQPSRILPYLQVLDRHAFGNFRELLTAITLNPAMGRYLDMVGNKASAPNENYAREFLQLFTIGVNELNRDGKLQRDAQRNPIPAYTQETVNAFARVFTGWVFAPPPQPGIIDYFDPLVPGNTRTHDRQEKVLLRGVTLPAGRDAVTDLHAALDNVFSHPNVGPFICKQLIQHLVTSNPGAAYVRRVAEVFTATQGDMPAVLRAILLDPEARHSTGARPSGGHLREPVLWITHLLRTFNTTEATTDFVLGESFLPADLRMGQDLLRSPSVFNFFPPDYVVPDSSLYHPEFAIYSTATALARTNFAYEVIYQQMPTDTNRPKGTWLDLSPLEPLASDPSQLVDTLDTLLLHGKMTSAMRKVIEEAVSQLPASPPLVRVQEAVYLIVTSPQYLVER